MNNLSLLWISIGIISFVIELLTPTFFFLSIAFGAIIAWLTSLITEILIVQIIVFLAGFSIFFLLLKPLLYKNNKEKFNSESLIGTLVYTNSEVTDKKGSVKLNGSVWQARTTQGIIEINTKVKIESLDGNKLIVTKE